MSQFHNNNFLHNMRVGVRMIQAGMHPDLASHALAIEGIIAPSEMLAAAATPGVLDSMGAKSYGHARADRQIAAHQNMKASLAEIQAQAEPAETEFVD